MTKLEYKGSGERIDKRLPTQFPYARNFFHHIIARWWITLENKPLKKSYKLKKWDIITIDDLQRYLSPIILEESPNIDLEIKIEKEDYLVVYKTKWVLSHPNSVRDVANPSVVWFLYHRYKKLPTIWNFIRSWLIHRLDKETDGMMIIAKTEKWLSHFKSLFHAKSLAPTIPEKENIKLKKYYCANCYITNDWQVFLEKIKDNLPFTIEEMVIPKVPHSIHKLWITKILQLENNPQIENFSNEKNQDTIKIKLEILTWRTHQIRYHLSEHWLPIIWDYVYGTDEAIDMQLTAYKLEFLDTEGEYISLEI